MRWWLLTATLLTSFAMADTLTDALTRFDALHSYQVTLRSTAASGDQQVIRYFYRKPGWVRMDFVTPHSGAVLVYSPDTRRARLWPFGLHHWPTLDLSPDNPLLRGPQGHRVDRSDVGVLLADVVALRARGHIAPLGDARVAGRPAVELEVVGATDSPAGHARRFRIWLADDTLFPLRADSFDANGRLIESVDMSDAQIDVPFPERLFTP
jgi:outer membrane lipoprotein-sorting protein